MNFILLYIALSYLYLFIILNKLVKNKSSNKETNKRYSRIAVIYILMFLFAVKTEYLIKINILDFASRIHSENTLQYNYILSCSKTVSAAYIYSSGENIYTVKLYFLVVLIRETGFYGIFIIFLDRIYFGSLYKI